MPQYLTPGVYIEEIEGPTPIAGVSTSTAGFLGITEFGSITATEITSFDAFTRQFGNYLPDSSYLAYAVYGFFLNGGQRCYIGRITSNPSSTSKGATSGSVTLTLVPGSTPPIQIIINAIGPGIWSNNLFYSVGPATINSSSTTDPRFKLTLVYYSNTSSSSRLASPIPSPMYDPTDSYNKTNQPTDPSAVQQLNLSFVSEVYDNLSVDPNSSSFYKNEIAGVSNFVTVADNIPTTGSVVVPLPTPTTPHQLQPFKGGDDGAAITQTDYTGTETTLNDPWSGTPIGIQRTGLTGFKEIDDISIIAAPEQASDNQTNLGLTGILLDHCETPGLYRIAVLQSQQSDIGNISSQLQPARGSKYAALYLPWINVLDPVTNAQKLIPAVGHIAGIYARSDDTRGVQKAPANELVYGANSLQRQITADDQSILNPIGINAIRTFPGKGILVYGARTTSTDTLWQYVNVRRIFLYIEQSLVQGTQWVVFEPNNERLWARVIATIRQFLIQVWHDGALMGTKPDEAFFVKCDRSTMTQNDIDNGRLILVIGIAPVKPAEFVIIRIAQIASGAQVTE
jgi:uncharacterized protein